MDFNLSENVKILQNTPIAIRMIVNALPESWVKNNEGENTWSPYDIIGHLIHGEKTDWIPRAKIILNEESNKTFEPFDRFAQFENSKGKSIVMLLEEFESLRSANINELQKMPINETTLQRKGIHPELGPVTLENLLSTWVVHDLGHISQLARVSAKNHNAAVGPWRQYLSILKH